MPRKKRDHQQRNNTLLDEIRRGNHAARALMAEENIGLVIATADNIMRGSWKTGLARWHEREELVERGCHALCKACAKIENVRSSVGGYLRAAVRNAMVTPDEGLVKWLPKGRHVWPSLDAERIHNG